MRRRLLAAVVRSGICEAEAVRCELRLAKRVSGVCSETDSRELGRLCFLRCELRGSLGSEAAVSVEFEGEVVGGELSSVLIDDEVFVGAGVDVDGLVWRQEDVFFVELRVSAGRDVLVLAALGAVRS